MSLSREEVAAAEDAATRKMLIRAKLLAPRGGPLPPWTGPVPPLQRDIPMRPREQQAPDRLPAFLTEKRAQRA